MTVIDFYGLPGSGKSTVSHEIAIDLRKKYKKVLEPTYFISHKINKILRIFIKSVILIFSLFNIDFYRFYKYLAKKNLSNKDLIYHLWNIAYKLFFIKFFSYFDYIVFDEGIIQSLISLAIDYDIEINSIIKENYKKINTFSVYLDLPVIDCIEFMSKRKTNNSRAEKILNYDNKIKYLEKYNLLCELVSVNSCKINTKDKKITQIKEEILANINI